MCAACSCRQCVNALVTHTSLTRALKRVVHASKNGKGLFLEGCCGGKRRSSRCLCLSGLIEHARNASSPHQRPCHAPGAALRQPGADSLPATLSPGWDFKCTRVLSRVHHEQLAEEFAIEALYKMKYSVEECAAADIETVGTADTSDAASAPRTPLMIASARGLLSSVQSLLEVLSLLSLTSHGLRQKG
jgi:hypothetical protein